MIWDVDGTLAETERDGHRVAFNAAFAEHGLPWRWDSEHYGRLLAVAGGRERLLHDLAARPDAPACAAERERLARALHAAKNAAYERIVAAGGIGLRPGVRELMDECAVRGVPMAIATTTGQRNVAALLGRQLGGDWPQRFACVLGAEDAPRKKPDPQVYEMALARLGLPAHETMAIEDSPAGVAAACAAGVPVVVTRSAYFAAAEVTGARAVGPGLHTSQGWQPPLAPDGGAGRVGLDCLAGWLAAPAGRLGAPG